MRTEDNYGIARNQKPHNDSYPPQLENEILHSSQLENNYTVMWATIHMGSAMECGGFGINWSLASCLLMGSQFCHLQMWRTIFETANSENQRRLSCGGSLNAI